MARREGDTIVQSRAMSQISQRKEERRIETLHYDLRGRNAKIEDTGKDLAVSHTTFTISYTMQHLNEVQPEGGRLINVTWLKKVTLAVC